MWGKDESLLLGFVCTILPWGCNGSQYRVEVRFEEPQDAQRAQYVEVALVASCDEQPDGAAPVNSTRSLNIHRMSEAEPFGPAAPGTYGLYARALSTDCRVVAAGCISVQLMAGGTDTLVVSLTSRDIEACSPAECIDGACSSPDGGTTDASTCNCPSCADCAEGACLPDNDRCSGDEYCHPRDGCQAPTPCAEAEPRCPADDSCTVARCDESGAIPLCVFEFAPDGTSCRAGGLDGRCRSGACCAGCWDGASCLAGTAVDACGNGGAECMDCDDDNPCTDDLCDDGCTNTPDDDNPCPDGKCHGGACCEGCWDGVTCRTGDESAACGVGGEMCIACACPMECAGGSCEMAFPTADVETGEYMTCAIATDGALHCWGDNSGGQLGLGDDGPGTERLVPHRVGTATNWTAVAGGQFHTCGLRGTELYCWGMNEDGQLGLDHTFPRLLPTRVPGAWDGVLTRDDRTCAFGASDGQLYCTGENNDGELGIGDTADRWTLTLVPPPSGATSWTSVALGADFTCAVDSASRLWCWGFNHDGQLATGASSDDPNPDPLRVEDDTDWVSVCAGDTHACAIKSDGSLYCWGRNAYGQLGLDHYMATYTPAPVNLNGRSAARCYGGEDSTCVITTTRELHCWGENYNGQLGQGSTYNNSRVPVRVGSAADWQDVALGQEHTCGVRSGGELYCWGRNSAKDSPRSEGGQLGLGDRLDRASPTRVCFAP